MADDTDMVALREKYRQATGKQPFMGWDAEELNRRITENAVEPSAAETLYTSRNTPPDPAPEDPRVQVVITADHIFLPLDEAGNVPTDYHANMDTTRVVRRTRLKVPKDMAEGLSATDKAEAL